MAELNLREYVAKLGDWAQEGSADHVVWHARHILQYFPKNVDAYRYVGQALASLGHLEEASAVLRRVLSVVPDDRKAHGLLSEIYERLNRPNEAIWHMERAYEQDTNDPEIIDQLQRLYRDHRHITNPRLHLTTAAAARQDIRSGAYDRAVNALRSALDRSPQRADLQLLLAQGLWQRGDLVDAAEIAMDVLRTYPDCLAANQIMAELWLREGRPSDAQGYVDRLESIDPYLALELVQPGKSDPNTFRLPELDFDKSTQKAMVGDKLDWLEGIDATDAPAELLTDHYGADVESWLQVEPEAEEMVAETSDTSSEAEDDWLSQLDSIEQSYNVSTNDLQITTSPLSATDEPAVSEIEDAPVSAGADVEDEADLSIEWMSDSEDEPEAVAEDDPFKWLLTPDDELDEDIPATIETEDPLAWMRQADIELPDTTELSPEMLQEVSEEDEDSMSWLRDYNTDAIGDWQDGGTDEAQETADELPEPSLDELSFVDDDELLLDELPFPSDEAEYDQDIGIAALLDEPELAEIMSSPDESPEEEAIIDSPVHEWEASEALLEESFGIEALTDTPAESFGLDDDFPFASQEEIEMQADEANEVDQVEAYAEAEQDPEQGNIMSDTPPEFEWLDDDSETSGEPPSTGATGMLDWLSRSEPINSEAEEDVAEAVGSEAFQPEDGSTGMTDTLNWMEGDDAPEDETPEPDGETTEGEAESTGSTGMLNWLSQNRPLPPTMPLKPHDIAEQAQASAAEDDEAWLESLEDEELSFVDEESTGATSMLDWLGKEGAPPTGSLEPAATGELENADEWLADIMAEQEAPQEVDTPLEWEPQPEVTAAEADLENLDWLNTEALTDEPDEEVMPDDLTMIDGIEPEIAVAFSAAGITSFQSLAEASEEDLFAALQAQDLNVMFDPSRWIAQAHFLAEGDIQGFYNFQDSVLGAEQDQTSATDVAAIGESFSIDDEPDTAWYTEGEAVEGEEVSPEIDEWLAINMSLEDEDEEPASEPEQEANLDWLSEGEPAESDEESAEEPEWLATTMSVEDDEEESAAEPADLDWLSEDEPADSDEEALEEPEWLATTMSAEDDDEEPVAESGALDWLGEDEPADSDEEAEEEPEWLASTAMFVENAVEEPSVPEAEAELDWLGQDEPADSDEEPQDQPEWLTSTAMFVENAIDEPSVPEAEAELDWLGQGEPADSDEEPQDQPEWLASTAMFVENAVDEPSAPEAENLDWFDEDEEAEPVEELQEETEWPAPIMSVEDEAEEPEAEPADLDWLEEEDEEEAVESDEEAAEAPEWVTATEALQGTIDASEAEVWLAEELAAAKDGADLEDEELESVEAMLLDEGEEESLPEWMSEEQEAELLGDAEFDPLAAIDAAEVTMEADDVDSEGVYELENIATPDGDEVDEWNLEAEPYADVIQEEMVDADAEAEPDDYYTAFEDAPEAAEIAPAPNAPDWLNAMVPGLDIDYEAEEDEPLETEFEMTEEDELEPTMPEDFGWVNEIVEEETQPEPVLEGIQERAPRFVFSRPPVWLRRLLERGSQQSSENDDDLPAWLR